MQGCAEAPPSPNARRRSDSKTDPGLEHAAVLRGKSAPVHRARDRETYSVRRAFMGSTEAARLAGSKAASNATSATNRVPASRVTGSNVLTP